MSCTYHPHRKPTELQLASLRLLLVLFEYLVGDTINCVVSEYLVDLPTVSSELCEGHQIRQYVLDVRQREGIVVTGVTVRGPIRHEEGWYDVCLYVRLHNLTDGSDGDVLLSITLCVRIFASF